MKTLSKYIFEKLNKENIDIVEASKKIYDWFVKNIGNYYDHEHGRNKDNLFKCSLLDNQYIKADCAGYVAAVLAYVKAIPTSDLLHYNVRHGSFYANKKILSNVNSKFIPNKNVLKTIKYIADNKKFKHYKYDKSLNKTLKVGDILYGVGHICIVAQIDGDNIKIYDWGRRVENNKSLNSEPIDIYYPDVLKNNHDYIGFWRYE